MAPVTVVGSREVRDLTAVEGAALREAAPGSGPLKLLDRLPGVMWTGADNLGNYEWTNDLSVRGFSLNQIGFTLDDIPLGSTHFWYYNGIDPNRAIAPENLVRITLKPGSGSPEAASYNALGATVQLSSGEPEKEFGVRARQSFGEYRNLRTYARLDTGELASGATGYLSVSGTVADKWKGMGNPGQQPFALFSRDAGEAITGAGGRWGSYHDQLNLKLTQPLGEHKLTLYYAYSDKRENDYADLTLPVYRTAGRNFDNYSDWRAALTDVNEDAYYGSAMSYRRDHLAALTGEFRLADRTTLKLTPYFQHDWGYGDWHMPSSDNGLMTDMQYRRSAVQSDRSGVNSSLVSQHGAHRLNLGLWFEESRFTRRRYLYDLVDWRVAPDVDLSSPATTLLDRIYDTRATQFHARDDILLGEKWLVSLGAKASRVESHFEDRLGVYATNNLVSQSAFLPQLGVNYLADATNEYFAYYAENIGAVPITVFTTKVFNPDVKPERTRTLEGGWRYSRDGLNASLAAYVIDYRDRLLQINNCSLLGTCPSLVANVGAVRKSGIEGTAQWRFEKNWTAFTSLSYSDSRYRDDYQSQGKTVATAGKVTVNSPEWLAAWELRWQNSGWFTALKGKYVGSRYASYTDDLSVPSFTLWSMVAGYECKSCLGLRNFRAQFNLENLTDRDYIATIGQSGFSANEPSGANTYVQVGAPRMGFFSVAGQY
ncbi:MAG: TonB-dependent receptor [Sulfuricella sp.]|nr:TonB-dependent receptor [Sulfuricella sp.]